MFLRNLPDGVHFELVRTGEKFKLVERCFKENRWKIICLRRHDGKLVELNHQCVINPTIKPKIKLKFNKPTI